MEPNAELTAAILKEHERFVITTHVNPDGDALGSELALAIFLEKLGKKPAILNHSPTPDNYTWLDRGHRIAAFMPERDRDAILGCDAILVVDANQPERLRSMEPLVLQSTAPKIVIDHHLDPHPFAQHYLIDDDATSTGEIIYRLLALIDPALIDREIAEALYTAIMTDTGSFRYPRTDPEIHEIAARLLAYGLTPIEIYSNVYDGWSEGRMRLLGQVLHSLRTEHGGKLAYIVCTQDMFKETGTTPAETDNFTSYPMSIRGVQVGILFNELANGVKISFRSKGSIPINLLAKEFGGNGHTNAAGARILDARLPDVVRAVVEKCRPYVNSHNPTTTQP